MDKRKKELFSVLERVSLSLFMVSLFFNVQKVWVPNVFSSRLPYNEYLDTSIYLFDIFFFLWLGAFILNNKECIKSIISQRIMFHVKHYSFVYWIIFFLGWSLLSVFTHNGFFETKLLAFIRLFEGISLFFLILLYSGSGSLFHVKHESINSVPRGTWLKFCSTWNMKSFLIPSLYLIAFCNALLALLQFFSKYSLGLSFLGESYLNTALPGVAKVILFNELYLRGYGFFVHPNILAAFLGFVLLLFLRESIFKIDDGNSQECSTWNKKEERLLFHVKQLFFFIIVCAFLITFSKAAFITVFLVLSYLYVGKNLFHVKLKRVLTDVPHETRKKRFHVKHMLGLGVIFVLLYSTYTEKGLFLKQSFTEREYGYVEFAKNISTVLFFGLGIGGYVPHLYDAMSSGTPYWLLQPVHNIYFLIYAELGSIGVFLFVMSLLSLWGVPRETFKKFKSEFHVEQDYSEERFKNAIILYLLLLGIFDHYLWDIPQGIFLFWLALGIAAASNNILTNREYRL